MSKMNTTTRFLEPDDVCMPMLLQYFTFLAHFAMGVGVKTRNCCLFPGENEVDELFLGYGKPILQY